MARKFGGNMNKFVLVSLFCAASLSASAASAFDMKIISLTSTGVEMSGTIHAKLNMTSTFELASADGSLSCTGTTNAKGVGTLTCDGDSLPLAIQGYGKLSGAYLETYPDLRVAIAWGKKASRSQLEALLQ